MVWQRWSALPFQIDSEKASELPSSKATWPDNDRSLSEAPRQTSGQWRRYATGRGAFDKAVSSEPFAFAADAVLIYGYSMPFWYFSTIGEDADVWGEDFCGRWHALMLLRIGRAKQDCP